METAGGVMKLPLISKNYSNPTKKSQTFSKSRINRLLFKYLLMIIV